MPGVDITSDGLALEIRKRYEEAARDKMYIVQDAQLDLQFIKGNQHFFINAVDKNTFDILVDESSQEKITFNRMGQIYQKRSQILLRNIPDIKSKPTRKKIESDKKARITNALIDKIKRDNDMKSKYKSYISKLETQGFAFIKIIYDHKMGELLKLEMNRINSKENIFGEMDSKKVASVIKKIKEGGISFYVGGLYELYVSNPRSSKLSENDFILHAKAFHIDDIKKAYGVTVNAQPISRDMKQERYNSNSVSGYDETRLTNKPLENYAMVYEYYEKPTHNRPRGLKIVVAGDEVISISDLPYQCGRNNEFDYNFVVTPQIPLDSYFYGHSIYRDLRPVQRRYNNLRNIIYEYMRKVSIGQYQVPRGALEDSSQLTNDISGVIEINAMYGEIKELPLGKFPQETWRELETCLQEFSSISSLSMSTLLGNTPANIRSGDQMDKVSQSDEQSAGLSVDNIIDTWIEVFEKSLRIIKQKANKLPIEIFDNDGLDKIIVTPENIVDDIEVINAGVLGLTKLQEERKVLQAMQMGLLNKEGANAYGDKNTFIALRAMGLGHLEIDSDIRYQEEFANVENNKMIETDEPITVNDWDDDAIHIKIHERMFMSSEYQRAIKLDANGAQKHQRNMEHTKEHKERYERAMMRQQLLAAQQQS